MGKARGTPPFELLGNYLLVFFAFDLMVLAAAFGFAAFSLIAIDPTPPSAG
jgi:hypothetical protein